MNFKDLDLHDIGSRFQISGVVLSSENGGTNYVLHFPDEAKPGQYPVEPYLLLGMEVDDWERFIYQSDMLDVFERATGQKKALLRKSQRQIDTNVSWAVFRRDEFQCRYCAKQGPLTVDHIILWEAGGPSVVANLLATCKRCNRTRGNMPYEQWIQSEAYRRLSANISGQLKIANDEIVYRLPQLEMLKVDHVRSR